MTTIARREFVIEIGEIVALERNRHDAEEVTIPADAAHGRREDIALRDLAAQGQREVGNGRNGTCRDEVVSIGDRHRRRWKVAAIGEQHTVRAEHGDRSDLCERAAHIVQRAMQRVLTAADIGVVTIAEHIDNTRFQLLIQVQHLERVLICDARQALGQFLSIGIAALKVVIAIDAKTGKRYQDGCGEHEP
jgi:hypothetical protein